MYRIDSPTAAAALPAPLAAGDPGYFAHAAPGSGNVPTIVSSDWANGIQEELMSILAAAGVEPDKTNRAQVLQSILGLIDTTGVNSAGSLYGLNTSNTPGLTTSSISVAVGQARDSSNSKNILVTAPIAKLLTANFAAGSGNGGRFGGVLANGQTWFVFVILNPVTGAVDVGFDQSPTAPTMPAGYTKFRRIGAILLEAASTQIRQYIQTGDWFKLKTRSSDYAVQANGGAASFRLVTVPVGIKVEGEFYFQSTGSAQTFLSGIFDPDFGLPAAFGGATQWAQVRRDGFAHWQGGYVSYVTTIVRQFTDTTGHVYTFSNDAGDVIALGVLGWRDDRGRV
jgi:hypothetical protein